MSVEDAIIVADQAEYGWQGIVNVDERYVLIVLSREVIDLEMTRLCFDGLGRRARQLSGK